MQSMPFSSSKRRFCSHLLKGILTAPAAPGSPPCASARHFGWAPLEVLVQERAGLAQVVGPKSPSPFQKPPESTGSWWVLTLRRYFRRPNDWEPHQHSFMTANSKQNLSPMQKESSFFCCDQFWPFFSAYIIIMNRWCISSEGDLLQDLHSPSLFSYSLRPHLGLSKILGLST